MFFESLYVNWDPGNFSHADSVHWCVFPSYAGLHGWLKAWPSSSQLHYEANSDVYWCVLSAISGGDTYNNVHHRPTNCPSNTTRSCSHDGV